MLAKLLSVQVGKPVSYPSPLVEEKTWRSAIDKRPVDGPVWVRALGLDGDAQADRRVHGGPYQAVNVYPSEHYAYWRQTPGLEAMTSGAFGENFTTQGLLEDQVCIGDVYRVGEVIVRLTQPRGPCYKLNRRWQSADLQQRADQSARVGWYFSVVEEGRVQAGDTFERIERSSPGWTVQRAWKIISSDDDQAGLRQLVEVQGLSEPLVERLRKLIK